MTSYADYIRSETRLISYWRMGASSTTELVPDEMGLNDLIPPGTEFAPLSTGIVPGSDGWASYSISAITSDSTPTGLSFNGRLPFSIELWTAPAAAHAGFERDILSSMGRPMTTDEGYRLTFIGASGPRFYRYGAGGSDVITGAYPIYTGRLVHLVATYDGSYMRVYADGRSVAPAVASSRSIVGTWTIDLLRPMAGTLQYIGALQEVAIYGVALAAKEIEDHYKLGRASFPDPQRIRQIDPITVDA